VLAESLGDVPLVDGVECVAKVERGEVGVSSVQGALQSTFDSPYHRLDPSLAPDTKLVRQQKVTSVGVSDWPPILFPFCSVYCPEATLPQTLLDAVPGTHWYHVVHPFICQSIQ
jgi:hypothetical protein